VTLMLQDAEDPDSGLFQYTDPIRTKRGSEHKHKNNDNDNDKELLPTLELKGTADVFRDHEHDEGASDGSSRSGIKNSVSTKRFAEHEEEAKGLVTPINISSSKSSITNTNKKDGTNTTPCSSVHTLDFRPGTLLVLAGSKSLHRVTTVKGNRSRFVAVLTFASRPGFYNTPEVQTMFWGRTASSNK
jgi:hypothetical protein